MRSFLKGSSDRAIDHCESKKKKKPLEFQMYRFRLGGIPRVFGMPVDYDEKNSRFASCSSCIGQAVSGLIPDLWVRTISPEPFSKANQSVLSSRYIKVQSRQGKENSVSLAHGTINEPFWPLLEILYLSLILFLQGLRRDSKLREPRKSNGLGVRAVGALSLTETLHSLSILKVPGLGCYSWGD